MRKCFVKWKCWFGFVLCGSSYFYVFTQNENENEVSWGVKKKKLNACVVYIFFFPFSLLQEIAAILISFGRHPEWLSKEVKIRLAFFTHSFLFFLIRTLHYFLWDFVCWGRGVVHNMNMTRKGRAFVLQPGNPAWRILILILSCTMYYVNLIYFLYFFSL